MRLTVLGFWKNFVWRTHNLAFFVTCFFECLFRGVFGVTFIKFGVLGFCMVAEIESKKILERLDEIKSDLDYIKDRLSSDAVLTEDDLASLDEAERDLKQGKTKRL